jgi:hypothetical protein
MVKSVGNKLDRSSHLTGIDMVAEDVGLAANIGEITSLISGLYLKAAAKTVNQYCCS